MERIKISVSDESIILKTKFITDSIIPICITNVDDNMYKVLFSLLQRSTEEYIFVEIPIVSTDKENSQYLDDHPLNMINIRKNQIHMTMYNESIKTLEPHNLYVSDFNMSQYEDNKLYFKADLYRMLPNEVKPEFDYKNKIEVNRFEHKELLITKGCFCRIGLFFNRFAVYDPDAYTVFLDRSMDVVEFMNVTYIKYDGSAIENMNSIGEEKMEITYSHYVCKEGHTEYKFNFLAPHIVGRSINNFHNIDLYRSAYDKDDLITRGDIIQLENDNKIYIVLKHRSLVTDKISVKVLVMEKYIYDHSNLIDISKIYKSLEED